MTMQGFLHDRDLEREQAADLARRDAASRAWMNRGVPEAERLLKFDSWVRVELEKRVDWTSAGAGWERRLEQCRIELENLVCALWRRGWQLDGERLAGHIRDALDDVAKAQRAGRVKDFWPFFKAVVDRYVGVNAEEIKEEAMRAGVHVGQVFEAMTRRLPAGRSLPELVALRRQEQVAAKDETLRQRLARQRAKDAARIADAQQPQLF